ncbi:hypothetical protein QCA50_005253 [Cerrena zonata]|uniref:MYND-type domain-containing protein n=1 Tax=Cerrena zonata TaxID=2478898 RepID=A0AAW0GL22_9APHY
MTIWLIQTGLLRVLLCSDRQMEQLASLFPEYKDIVVNFLSDIFRPFCIFKSFVTALHQEMDALRQLGTGIDISNSHLRGAFQELKLVVETQMVILCDVQYEPIRVYQICNGPTCRAKDTEHRFRRCGGCFIDYYCSAECQKSNWSSHKAMCLDTRQRLSHCHVGDIPSPDMKYLKKIIAYHLTRISHNPNYDPDFEESRNKRLHIQFNFQKSPFEISVAVDQDGIPGIEVMATVSRGSYTRSLTVETTLEELTAVRTEH